MKITPMRSSWAMFAALVLASVGAFAQAPAGQGAPAAPQTDYARMTMKVDRLADNFYTLTGLNGAGRTGGAIGVLAGPDGIFMVDATFGPLTGKVYVKISGAYRVSTKAPDYPDAAPLARALIAANAERIVWGSDWPHPSGGALPGHGASDLAPLLQIDDGRLLNQLVMWAPDAAVRKTILVDNPARLYRF